MLTHFDGMSGTDTVAMTIDDAKLLNQPGRADDNVAAILAQPGRVKFMTTPDKMRKILKEYGAWDDLSTADDDTIRSRMLWVAAGDIAENPEMYA